MVHSGRLMLLYLSLPYACTLKLTYQNGWKYKSIVERLEERRKAKSSAYYAKKKAHLTRVADAKKASETSKELAKYGF